MRKSGRDVGNGHDDGLAAHKGNPKFRAKVRESFLMVALDQF